MAKLKVREFSMSMHMKMTGGHSYVYSGYLDEPGHPMDGKVLVKKVWSPKQGDKEVQYMVDDGSTEPPVFKTLIFLMDHYKLKPMEE